MEEPANQFLGAYFRISVAQSLSQRVPPLCPSWSLCPLPCDFTAEEVESSPYPLGLSAPRDLRRMAEMTVNAQLWHQEALCVSSLPSPPLPSL